MTTQKTQRTNPRRTIARLVAATAAALGFSSAALAQANALDRVVDLPATELATPEWSAENTIEGPTDTTIWTVEGAEAGFIYWIAGDVKADAVAEGAYLEMISDFGDGPQGPQRFFTKAVSNRGLTQNLDGDQDWRPFALPFFRANQAGPMQSAPQAIELRVVMPGEGTVTLRNVALMTADGGPEILADFGFRSSAAWWGQRTNAMIGTVGGIAMGFLGALVGILFGIGRGRSLCFGALTLLVAGSAVLLVLGVVAAIAGQPVSVVFSPLFVGIIGTSVGTPILLMAPKWFQARELHRMRALEATA